MGIGNVVRLAPMSTALQLQETGHAKVLLRRGKAGASIGRHPWVFANTIEKIEGTPEEGGEVFVYGDDGRFISRGLYNSRSEIRVRLYSFEEHRPVDAKFFEEQIESAFRLRVDLLRLSLTDSGVRLVFSEADGLSGLIIDSYSEYLILQVTSLGIYKNLSGIVSFLKKRLRPKGIFIQYDSRLSKVEGLPEGNEILFGELPQDPITIEENGIRYEVHLLASQKTGFYIDQRDNRKFVRKFAEGRKVLDLCCYTGGFALNLLQAGAKSAVGVDLSEFAIAQAQKNAKLNQLDDRATFILSPIDEYLLQEENRRAFDLVVMDPPKLAGSKKSKINALRAYYRMNELAIDAVKSEGIFVSCSCSGQITQDEFLSMLASVCRRKKRTFQLLELRSQAADHPINLAAPDTGYLKCAIGRII